MLNAQQGLVSCKPASQKTGETGCWIIASQPLGVLAKPVYFTMETFGTRELAERKRGPVGTVVEALGEIWLLSVEAKRNSDPAGTRVTQIGPLPIEAGQEYTAQYMEATLQPGMVSKTHIHSGVEVFYTETGETCVETPEGKQVGKKRVDIVIPQGVSMELTATGTQVRRGMMLVLHDSSKPPTTLVDSWKSKGLCKVSN
jgi:quercetin dioxygenase-like cupin family protein